MENPYVETILGFEKMSNVWRAAGNFQMEQYTLSRVEELKIKKHQWDLAAANVYWLCLGAQKAVKERTK